LRCRLPAGAVAGAVAALLAAGPARAGVPFVTDDPEPVEVNTWEVNSALTGTRQAAGTFALLPQVDINYGAAPGLQLHIQPQLAYASTPQGRSAGVGDTEIGVKYRLTAPSEAEGDVMVGLYPRVELPTGSASRNLGAGATSTYLPIWCQVTLGRWTGYGGGGYWINSASGSRNAWAAGWVALYRVTEGLQVGGEVYGKTADMVGGRSSSGFNLGAIYQLAKDTNLLFSAGRGLTDASATNQASVYLGVQVDY
jgi:Putative MetA-pathway of phenol degradation